NSPRLPALLASPDWLEGYAAAVTAGAAGVDIGFIDAIVVLDAGVGWGPPAVSLAIAAAFAWQLPAPPLPLPAAAADGTSAVPPLIAAAVVTAAKVVPRPTIVRLALEGTLEEPLLAMGSGGLAGGHGQPLADILLGSKAAAEAVEAAEPAKATAVKTESGEAGTGAGGGHDGDGQVMNGGTAAPLAAATPYASGDELSLAGRFFLVSKSASDGENGRTMPVASVAAGCRWLEERCVRARQLWAPVPPLT
ncbi:unnamed protein product, partial [Phaeothamnion confervicola]